MYDHVYLGSSPVEEACAQIGSLNYNKQALAELRELKRMMQEIWPEVAGGEYRIKRETHDFGAYYELVARFDDENGDAADWAYSAEDKVPDYWDERAREALGLVQE